MELNEINGIFEANDDFVILTHKSPDGDTLGTGFALCYYLREMGKRANVLNSDGFPARYAFMYEGYEPQEFEPKYVIAVDIADPNLMGSALAEYQQEGRVDLCIDHHYKNKQFAKLSYVEGDSPAAALILYQILKLSGREISRKIAMCLYTGIATDTGCFKYENTTPAAHIAAAELMGYGFDYARINRLMFDVRSRARIDIEQRATAGMEYYFDGKCAVITLTTAMMEEAGADPSDFEGFASIPLSAEGVVIGLTVKERHENVFKISVRTAEDMDASAFCQAFDGGGHIRAAGCEIRGSLDEVKKKLIAQVGRMLGVEQ